MCWSPAGSCASALPAVDRSGCEPEEVKYAWRPAAALCQACERLLNQITGDPRVVVTCQEQPPGLQGASGAEIRYFDVTSTDTQGAPYHETLVTKDATLLERRILRLLDGSGLCRAAGLSARCHQRWASAGLYALSDGASCRCDGAPRQSPDPAIAAGLAGIHAANRQQPPPWLPHVTKTIVGGSGSTPGGSNGNATWPTLPSPLSLGAIPPGLTSPWSSCSTPWKPSPPKAPA